MQTFLRKDILRLNKNYFYNRINIIQYYVLNLICSQFLINLYNKKELKILNC